MSNPRLATTRLPDGVLYTYASFTEDRAYRYRLGWSDGDHDALPVVIGLNPSGATDFAGDRTLCRIWGFLQPGFTMLNLFAYRCTDPADLLQVADPVGPANDDAISRAVEAAPFVVAAWGGAPHGKALAGLWRARVGQVRGMLAGRNVRCWGVCADGATRETGSPRHPLYLPREARLQAWP